MERQTQYDVILFDLDGTLTDPKIGITKSIQHGLSSIGIVEDNLDGFVSLIGAPIFECLRTRYSLSEPQVQRVVEFYRRYYSDTGIYENSVYPGVPELLRELSGRGRELLLATVKPTVFAGRVLQHFELMGYFGAIAGSNLDSAGFSKTEIIRRALAHVPDAPRQKIVMVGDRRHDVVGARSNGIACVAVAYGYGTLEELEEANPTHLARSMSDLRALLI
ncbi:HAD hydrolase-like protein [Candidatus Poribacteria bacterium]|nr:HAD hydrolase-like protein [Candidatus Poribacteria bacterium]